MRWVPAGQGKFLTLMLEVKGARSKVSWPPLDLVVLRSTNMP